MLILGEPPPTQGDLHFRLFGFPVRVHPFFWLVTLLLGIGGQVKPAEALVWVIVVFVSVLVHELGHAFLQRYYGGRPWITLYGFGGLASCNDCNRAPWPQILISLAGPLAGFILAGLVVAAIAVSGHTIGFALANTDLDDLMIQNRITSIILQPLILIGAYFEPYRSEPVNNMVADLLQVNILWGVINLLPIYPLDGGRIARELFTLRDARSGIVQSLQLSAGAAALVAAYALLNQKVFLMLMFGFLAYGSFQMMQAYRDRWR
jgi:Zn-dependent protease